MFFRVPIWRPLDTGGGSGVNLPVGGLSDDTEALTWGRWWGVGVGVAGLGGAFTADLGSALGSALGSVRSQELTLR